MAETITYVDHEYKKRLETMSIYPTEEISIVTTMGTVKTRKDLLLSASVYFRMFIKNNMKVMIQYDHDVVEQIIRYINTGSFDITPCTIIKLFTIACKTFLGFVQTSCVEYIISHINDSTCVGFLKTGLSNKCYKVYSVAMEYIRSRFEILSVDKTLLPLSYFELNNILKDDEVNVSKEDVILEFIIKWARYKKQNKMKTIGLMNDVLRYTYLTDHGTRVLKRWRSHGTAYRFIKQDRRMVARRRKYYTAKDVPYSKQDPTTSTKDEMERINKLIDEHHGGCGCVTLNDVVYLIGGVNKANEPVADVVGINTRTSQCVYVPNLNVARKLPTVSTLRNRIYAIGGVGTDGSLVSVESWTPGEDAWQIESNLLQARYNACSATLDNLLYVMGGANDFDKTVEVYSPSSRQWSMCNPMKYSHAGGCSTSRGDTVYVLGGVSYIDGIKVYTMVESYSTVTCTWRVESSLNLPRINASVCLVDESLIVLGGFMYRYIDEIEVYNDISKTWDIVGNVHECDIL
ncbi:gp014L [Rabbit fibroma virus]|uniref:Gp014L n=1 Tax=Rabbit fibroma virus (strain Kasza) TaxID=10272 RepID=Q9Q956_RFVKA|nr:kelch-like protein [Rabbit fibroma virus]AAF17898.1 gp014L [Rabbit fibroma virus]